MKNKMISYLLVGLTAVNLTLMPVYAAEDTDFGVKPVSEEAEDSESDSEAPTLDDIKLEETIEIEDYAKFTPLECITKDYDGIIGSSGETAEFLILNISLLNLKTDPVDFITDLSSVEVTYNEKYKYEGWVMQQNPENGNTLSEKDQYPIGPMYEGFYLIGCTLPNAVIEGDEPLVMTFKIGENEVTYNIR